jgi:peptidoglycan/LPS O-acetylase OafA/YrhL
MEEKAGHDLRKDIQAMRALAVVSVVAFHLSARVAPGGFTGVDVFFVISGFLITGNLVREAERSGRINVWAFWSRRARRLLPAALLVIATCVVGILALVPRNLWPQFLGESVASTFYVQNWALALASVDYLGANNVASPVQHFWTLSVEEQFYLFTPLLLLGILALSRRLHEKRRALVAGIAAVGLASFAYSIYLTAVAAPAAYFVTTTRAWEFCAGAGVLFLPPPRSRLVARLAVAAGLAGVVTAIFGISSSDPFPGALAAWPVLGAAAMIWGGAAAGRGWERATSFGPIQLLGRISYSTYLWHWPLIVLAPYALGHALSRIDDAAVVVATLVLAWLSTRFIEDPIRYSPRLLGRRRPATIFGWAAMGMALVAALAGSGLVVYGAQEAAQASRTGVVVASAPDCLGAMAVANAATCRGVVPPDTLVPDPAAAAQDTRNRADCWATVDSSTLHVCTLGPVDAPVRIAAIGDSHSNQYLAAYEAIAQARGWRIDVAGHNGCYWTAAVQAKAVQAQQQGCEAWKAALVAYLASAPPYDAIVVTNSRLGAPVIAPSGASPEAVAVNGLLAAWKPVMARGTRIIALRDDPVMAADVVSCVTRYGVAANQHCSRSQATAVGASDPLVEAAAQASDAALIDLTSVYCQGGMCQPVIGNVVVYSDSNHMTATFVRSLASILGDRIAAALPTSPGRSPSSASP